MSAAAPPPDPAAIAAAQAAFRQFSIEAFTLLAVGILVTILRTYARIRAVGIKRLEADDYLVWFAAICYAVETALAYSVGNIARGLANNGMTDEQRISLSSEDPEYRLRVIGCKIQISGWTTYSALLWALKASLLIFYLRLTKSLSSSYRLRIHIGFGLLLSTWIAALLNLFLACRPFHRYWQIYPNPGNVCQPAVSNQLVWVFLALNVSTDIYLLSIPVPMLWQANLRPGKKLGLMILFGGGLFVVACATLRCILIVADPVNGAQLAGSWAVRETFVAVVTTNLPLIFPLIKNHLTPIFGSFFTSMRSRRSSQKPTGKGLSTNGSGAGSIAWYGRGPLSGNPVTSLTATESEERIVDEVPMHDIKTCNNCGAHQTDDNNNSNNNTLDIRKNVEIDITREEWREQARRLQGNYPLPGSG